MADETTTLNVRPGPDEYLASHGGRFSGKYSATEPTPLELFDREQYAACAHACTYLLWKLQDAARALGALEDDAFLHELLHLATGVPLAQSSSLERIRAGIAGLWESASDVGAERLQPDDELAGLIRILADGADCAHQIGNAGGRPQFRFNVETIERVLLQLRRLSAITSGDRTCGAPEDKI